MKRLRYINELNKFLIEQPEVIKHMPDCILTEIYYFQRCQEPLFFTD